MITTPSGGQTLLDTGYYNVTGLAWSGRGKVRRVDVIVDGGRNWRTARLEGRCCRRPDPLQHRLGLGRRARRCCSRARSTRPATCSRRSTSCARCAARVDLSQQRDPVVAGRASGEVTNVQVSEARWRHRACSAGMAVAAPRRRRGCAVGRACIAAGGQVPVPAASAAPRRRPRCAPGTSTCAPISPACRAGAGSVALGSRSGKRNARRATACSASRTRCSRRSSAARRSRTSRPAASRASSAAAIRTGPR